MYGGSGPTSKQPPHIALQLCRIRNDGAAAAEAAQAERASICVDCDPTVEELRHLNAPKAS